jgi:prolipoprotein diacylglyceryltransferase
MQTIENYRYFHFFARRLKISIVCPVALFVLFVLVVLPNSIRKWNFAIFFHAIYLDPGENKKDGGSIFSLYVLLLPFFRVVVSNTSAPRSKYHCFLIFQ